MSVRVKICGLTRRSDVEYAIKSGADALGFIFGYPSSPRNLELAKLRDLLAIIPPFVSTVVVSPTSNTQLQKVAKMKPIFFQLYSEGESNARNKEFTNAIQTVRPLGESNAIVQRSASLSKSSKGILFDMSMTSRYSSKKDGRHLNLKQNLIIAKKIKTAIDPLPLIIGGGLTEDNVAEVIRDVRPYAVDVSSGVERSPGIKDEKKVARFIQTAKSAIGRVK
ncbi:MAG: phosphoribosylanthranilate isomerase [Nitrososphaerales archaeon]|jgi:phosphoribosylanthranilate isomerase